MIRHSIFVFFLMALSSCEYFQQKSSPAEPIARVGENYLYLDDLRNSIPKSIAKEDSTPLAEKIINDWIKVKLITSKAAEELSIDQTAINRKVEEYRFSLIRHEFEKYYIN